MVELEVSATGQIRSWRVLRASIPSELAAQRLKGLERTPMLAAVRKGKAVDARFTVEFSVN